MEKKGEEGGEERGRECGKYIVERELQLIVDTTCQGGATHVHYTTQSHDLPLHLYTSMYSVTGAFLELKCP